MKNIQLQMGNIIEFDQFRSKFLNMIIFLALLKATFHKFWVYFLTCPCFKEPYTQFRCIKYASIWVSENPYSRIFYAVFHVWFSLKYSHRFTGNVGILMKKLKLDS